VPLLVGGVALTLGSSVIAWYLGTAFAGFFALPYALLGAGAGLCSPAITGTIMGGLPATRAALASSIASASRQLGQTLGTAITGTVLIAGLREPLHAGFVHAGHPAWWVTAGFGAAILPLTLASVRRATSASRRSQDRTTTVADFPCPWVAVDRWNTIRVDASVGAGAKEGR
jgi:MFS family permease